MPHTPVTGRGINCACGRGWRSAKLTRSLNRDIRAAFVLLSTEIERQLLDKPMEKDLIVHSGLRPQNKRRRYDVKQQK